MSRRVRCSFVAAACLMSSLVSRSAAAQMVGSASRAADFAPVEATALGVTRQSSVGLSVNGSGFALGGGMGARGGALHAYLGGSRFEWATGLAYSHTSIARQVLPGLHATVGEQLSSGYRNFDRYGYL